MVEGYHLYVGGGFGPDAAIAREIYRDVKADDAPRSDRTPAQGLSRQPCNNGRNLSRLARRHDIDALKAMTDAEVVG